MTNHTHLLLERQAETVGIIMQRVLTGYRRAQTVRYLDLAGRGRLILSLAAGVAKLVYALDSKSSGLYAHVGSSPTSGTIAITFLHV
jgi:hypothetical protein